MIFAGIWHRMRAQWKHKVILSVILAPYFCLGYYFTGQARLFPAYQIPFTILDRSIPFLPEASFIYLSQLITMPLVLWMIDSRRLLMGCCCGLAFVMTVSFTLFFIIPTAIPPPEFTLGQYKLYDIIARADLPRNACPSLHAAFGVFIAGYAPAIFRNSPFRRGLVGTVWFWSLAVLISTLFVKQHVVLDLLAGSILGLSGWLLTRPKITPSEVRV